MKRTLLILFLLLVSTTACSSPTAAPPEPELKPTETELPTNTVLPPEPTVTLEAILFFDDFDDVVDSAWTWKNEDPDRWMITPEGWLAIAADDPSVIGSGQDIEQVNLLTQAAPGGDFIITTRLIADTNEDFQQAGIFLFLDGDNYVSILNAFCKPCLPNNGGYGVYMEGFKQSEPLADPIRTPRDPDVTDVTLRLIYSASENTVAGYVAITPDNWQHVGTYEDVPAFYEVGLGAANVPHPDGFEEDLIAFFDYFEISRVETPVRAGSPHPQPTPTPEPTATPEPTPLPEGILFRDDFEGYFQPGWTWLNEEPDRWTFTEEGWLEITGSNPAFYTEGNEIGLTNFLTRELPEGEFMITAHIKSNPTENFQQATIYIYEDKNNYVALNIGYCDLCPTGGPGFYMETFIDNNPFGDAYHILRDPEASDVYLRLVNQGGSVTGYFATSPGEWQRAAAFGNFFDFKLVGLGTTNSTTGGVENDIVSQFDYFEISLTE
jgi:regulation of enolase protein 1 (concanavalin A-like superfamily)